MHAVHSSDTSIGFGDSYRVVRLDYIGCWKDLIYWQIPQLF